MNPQLFLNWQRFVIHPEHQPAQWIQFPAGIPEVDSQVIALIGWVRLVYTKMELWFTTGESGIAALGDLLPGVNMIPIFHYDGVLLEVGVKCTCTVFVFDVDVIELTNVFDSALIRFITLGYAHFSRPCCGHILANWHRKIVGQLVFMAAVCEAVSLDDPVGFPGWVWQDVRGICRIAKSCTCLASCRRRCWDADDRWRLRWCDCWGVSWLCSWRG